MQRPKLLLPAALAVTMIGTGCGKKAPPAATPPAPADAVVVVPDAAPPDAAQAIWEPPDYPIG